MDILQDQKHCGDCRTKCPDRPNAPAGCLRGTCVLTCNPGFQNCDQNLQNGCETNVNTDESNCGRCKNTCPTHDGSQSECKAGQCTYNCLPGFGHCDKDPRHICETNLNTDPNNCSACGKICPSGPALHGSATCTSGTCGLVCDQGHQDCDGNLINGCETKVQGYKDDCTACGNFCPPRLHSNSICSDQNCVYTCMPGYLDCDQSSDNGCEIESGADIHNCGACGQSCPSGPYSTTTCDKGKCTFVCEEGYSDCDGDQSTGCEVKQGTIEHCTSCDACPTPETPRQDPVCAPGGCGFTCRIPYSNCDTKSGQREINLDTDPKNCGECGNVCPEDHGIATCNKGQCMLQCKQGFADCDGNIANGCETPLGSPDHCTSCDACPAPLNTTPACGQDNPGCGFTCTAPFEDCDSTSSNGCEMNTNVNIYNCGACNKKCPDLNGDASCVDGKCNIDCHPNFKECVPGEGCSIDITSDPLNCNGCGNKCDSQNGVPTCTAGECGIICDTGFGNCDSEGGCEVNINNDPKNCGACGTICSEKNSIAGSAKCVAGQCQSTCKEGYKDCNGPAANDGCEVNIFGPLKCGDCGKQCPKPTSPDAHGTVTCAKGDCGFSCQAPFQNCNGNIADGCEVNPNTDLQNCGKCQNKCPSGPLSTASCSGGVCSLICEKGWFDSNNNPNDGCETKEDTSSCGGCRKACASGPHSRSVCNQGSCSISCDKGWFDCNSDSIDGCERQESNSNGGSCGEGVRFT